MTTTNKARYVTNLEIRWTEVTKAQKYEPDEKNSIPMHPRCFELFKRASKARLGRVDIDGLWMLREVS